MTKTKAHLIDDNLVWLPELKENGELKSDLYQVNEGDVVKIDCKECSGLGYTRYMLECGCCSDEITCNYCTDGEQSYEITGPIELKRISDFLDDLLRLDQEYYTTLENKSWFCVSQAERIDK